MTTSRADRFRSVRIVGGAAALVVAVAAAAAAQTTALREPTLVPAGASATVRTSHVTVQATAGQTTIAPGARVSLSIEVTPRRGMHVYAPGKHDYQVVRFVLTSRPWLEGEPLTYPPSELYHFVPLDERVETYLQPFTLVQDVRVAATDEARKALAGQKTATVNGTLEYQACDDRICYAPTRVPLAFAFDVAPSGR